MRLRESQPTRVRDLADVRALDSATDTVTSNS